MKRRHRSIVVTVFPVLLLVTITLPGSGLYAPTKRNRRWKCSITFSQGLHRRQQQLYQQSSDINDDEMGIIDGRNAVGSTVLFRRQKQIRRKPMDRKPRNYWYNQTNLRYEMVKFWLNLGVKVLNENSPTIPNEVLLIYYNRHDIRAGIIKNGGRMTVSTILNNAPVLPGRWKDAILSDNNELQQLLQIDQTLSKERPPWINVTAINTNTNKNNIAVSLRNHDTIISSKTSIADNNNDSKLWSHHEGRNQKGHWNLQAVIQELYEYVDQYKLQSNRPSVWMPRPSELAANGRDDLRQAMNRFGGIKNICRTAGMIPYHEWYYFEGQYELLIELKQYLDMYANSDYSVFPNVSDIKRNGHDQLYNLIQYYGGRKFLSARFDMSTQRMHKNGNNSVKQDNYNSNDETSNVIKFGLFDLIFAIKLLEFVRMDQLQRSPPLRSPMIAMPSRAKLLSYQALAHDVNSKNIINGTWLDAKIDEYGGYENVARRLGLALFPTL